MHFCIDSLRSLLGRRVFLAVRWPPSFRSHDSNLSGFVGRGRSPSDPGTMFQVKIVASRSLECSKKESNIYIYIFIFMSMDTMEFYLSSPPAG